MRFAQQGIEHRGFGDMRKDDAEMYAELSVRRPEQKRLDVLAGRRLLEPADHRALPAVLGRLQDRERFAFRPVAQEQSRAEKIGRLLAAMNIQRAGDGGFNFGALIDDLAIERREIDGRLRRRCRWRGLRRLVRDG
jgi:hypothetical protein